MRHLDPRLRVNDSAVEIFLLGDIDFETCLALQQRLVYEAGGRRDGQIGLLLCEHRPLITIGRAGSRSHLHLAQAELTSRQLEVRWVNRGGGCLLHLPGQLAIYPIVPLEQHSFSVGEYLRRLQSALVAVLADFGIAGQLHPGTFDIAGRTGQLVGVGAAVKNWISYYGAYLNVSAASRVFRYIEFDAQRRIGMSSMIAERQSPVKMAAVRASVIRRVTDALGCERYHIYTGHPLLAAPCQPSYESTAV